MKTLIKGGLIVLEKETLLGDLLVEDGIIKDIGANIAKEADQIIHAEGMVVLPGGIDVHTHFNLDVGIFTTDDFLTGTTAAAFGGNTAIVDHMAFGPKGCDLHHQVKVYEGYTKGKCVIDYGLHGVIQEVNESILEEMESMVKEGIPSFKIYMTYDYLIEDLEAIEVLKRLKELNGITAVHCENDAIIKYMKHKLLKEGKTEPKYHAVSRPESCESEAVNRMITLAAIADDAPLYIVHVSAEESVNLIRKAREKGNNVYGETCPQYLFLDESCYEDPGDEGLKYIMSPPLRNKRNQEALWEGLRDGTLMVVATDHCTFDFHGDKQRGKDDFTKCPNGGPGVETRIPLMYSEGVGKGRMTHNKFADIISTNPAKLFGLYPKKGVLAIGSDADVMIIDPNKQVTIVKSMLHENVDYTPYEGFEVKGWPILTMVRGRIVVENGKLMATPLFGEFIHRKRSG